MKQKMVIKLQVESDDDRSKAMKIAVAAYGVISVAMEGQYVLVVIGEGIDPVTLTVALRKKICCANKKIRSADLVLPEEVKPEEKKKKEEKPCQMLPVCQPPFPPYWEVYPYSQPSGCFFM